MKHRKRNIPRLLCLAASCSMLVSAMHTVLPVQASGYSLLEAGSSSAERIRVQAAQNEAGKPVLASSTGSVWNGEASLRLYWNAENSTALDAQSFTLKKGADRYEIKDGHIQPKEGVTPAAGDEIVVESTLFYYEQAQLLWNENMETEGSLIPSVQGKYCVSHSSTAPRSGLKAATTVSENVKDGMWSKAINSTGTLVFWYYDPATPEEMDQEALAARTNPSFDQMKFGMTINNYPDFLFGTAIPASGDKGKDGTTMTMAERAAYSQNYVIRYGGNWKRTSTPRTKGWHKMEAAVTASGTTLKIDGEDVCLLGESTPLTIPGVKSISKAGLATNWGDKKETKEFIQEKHFIDDIYVLKDNAGAPKTETAQFTIRVERPDDEKDRQAVSKSMEAVENLVFDAAAPGSIESEEAARALAAARVQAVIEEGVQAEIEMVSFEAAENGTSALPEGKEGKAAFRVILSRNAARMESSLISFVLQAEPWQMAPMQLTLNEDAAGVIAKGKDARIYLDNSEDYAIESVTWSSDNPHVKVAMDGTVSLEEGYVPRKGETAVISAQVEYANPSDVLFTDGFEGDKKFTDADAASYTHTGKGSLFGRQAATAASANGYPRKDLGTLQDVKVTAWYHDANGAASQTKFGFGINGNSTALGVFYDGVIAPYVSNLTKDHYGARVAGFTYNNYAWGTTDAARSAGWHKFEWIVDGEAGLTEKIDGQIISTNRIAGQSGTDHQLVPVENNQNTKSLSSITLMCGWNSNADNRAEIQNRHLIDGVSVVRLDAPLKTETLHSEPIELQDTQYVLKTDQTVINSTWPEDLHVLISPYLKGETDLQSVLFDGKPLAADLWNTGMKDASVNASNFPEEMKGYQLTIDKAALKNIAQGSHVLTLETAAGSQTELSIEAAAETHVPRDYYLSNQGNDEADGSSPQSAWKTFEKLQSVTFGPGDHIYLDADSVWNDVQFRPEGSGAMGAPVVMSAYNNEEDPSRRPILNGCGTTADLDAHSYLAFDAWRAFYPSGTIELFNVEQWEIRGIEVTNYASEMTKGATGRNGIAVIFDYYETQNLTELPSGNAAREKAFYQAGKLQHIVIDDCYIHDVVGYHPANGAVGRGGKMSGGINVYGPYDDLQLCNNIVMYCDVEGIRNDVLAWMGDTRTQFPAYMENVNVSNNYIAGVPGDGVVISSAIKPVIENNYLTDAGYSYFAKTRSSNVSGVTWNASDLASCRRVDEKTGGTVKEMGNRQSPITMGGTNFAGLWFIGTKDAAAQYNEASNNVWTCNDGEAFDADMYCRGTVFQYNYTYRNNGGLCLFMPTMDEGTIVRYNISVEDGQSLGISESQNGLFHYIGTPEAIHNNVFVLSDKLATIFGGSSNTAYFYNNIVMAPDGLLSQGTYSGFHINGSSDGNLQNPKLAGEMKNNLFYPSAILNSKADGSTVVCEDNILLDEREDLDAVFEDLDGFLAAQPLHALKGRSAMEGQTVENLEYGKGAGIAMNEAQGRSVQVPEGGFDLSAFAGLRIRKDSLAAGAGRKDMRTWSYQSTNDSEWPLNEDFYKNAIDVAGPLDIGVHQISSEPEAPAEAADKTLLEMAVNYALAIQEAQDGLQDVNELVIRNFETRLAQAQAVLENANASQNAVDEAWQNLSSAIHMLNMKTDKRELLALIAQAEALDLDAYADGAAKDSFLQALDYAKQTAASPTALSEISISQAVAGLRNAMDALEAVQPADLDYTILDLVLEEAQKINLEDYLPLGQDLFEQKKAEALAVKEQAESQTEIDQAAAALHEAYLNLRLRPDESVLQALREFSALVKSLDAAMFTDSEYQLYAELARTIDAAIASGNLDRQESEVLKAKADTYTAAIEAVLKADSTDAVQTAGAKKTAASSVKTAASFGTSWVACGVAAAAGMLWNMNRRKKK